MPDRDTPSAASAGGSAQQQSAAAAAAAAAAPNFGFPFAQFAGQMPFLSPSFFSGIPQQQQQQQQQPPPPGQNQ
jgi:hypothetical protein